MNSTVSPTATLPRRVSLTLAVTQIVSIGTSIISVWPGCTSMPGSTMRLADDRREAAR